MARESTGPRKTCIKGAGELSGGQQVHFLKSQFDRDHRVTVRVRQAFNEALLLLLDVYSSTWAHMYFK